VRTSQTGEVSLLLRDWSDGDENALKKLTPIVYEELRRLARHYMRRERTGHSLQATALVNEAYLRLVDYKRMRWQNRAHFFAVSAQLMRRILVDHARRRNLKRGADVEHVSIEDAALVGGDRPSDLIVLDSALQALALHGPAKGTSRGTALFWRPERGRNRGSAEGVADHHNARLGYRSGLALPRDEGWARWIRDDGNRLMTCCSR
jgi:RNA polymerase sigma factor (TIGR02999 family)